MGRRQKFSIRGMPLVPCRQIKIPGPAAYPQRRSANANFQKESLEATWEALPIHVQERRAGQQFGW